MMEAIDIFGRSGSPMFMFVIVCAIISVYVVWRRR